MKNDHFNVGKNDVQKSENVYVFSYLKKGVWANV